VGTKPSITAPPQTRPSVAVPSPTSATTPPRRSIAPTPDDEGFFTPAFTEEVSLERYLAGCPVDGTTRGTFFLHVRDHVTKELGRVPEALFDGVTRRSWLPFNAYSLRDFMRLAHNGARLAYPRLPTSDGLRRIGWMSYPSFAATMAGRVVLFAFGDQLEDVVRAAPKAYGVGLPGATVTSRELAPQHWRFSLRDVYSFVDAYHYGVLEGAVQAFNRVPLIRLRLLGRPSDADFDVRWE
jgi:uncharacterized protein (TIGR02265 family)